MARLSSKIGVLTSEEIEVIHETAVRVIREVGMMIGDEGILRLMKNRGCPVQGNIVKFPQAVIDSYLGEVGKMKERATSGDDISIQFYATGRPPTLAMLTRAF